MNDITLITVSWNQKNCLELLLKSYLKYHYKGNPLKVVVVDNFSDDDTRKWLDDNKVPYLPLDRNEGHENGLNVVWRNIDSDYILINDTDIEYHGNVEMYLRIMKQTGVSSVGEIVENYFEQVKLVDRISPWFMLLDYKKLREAGIEYFRDPSVTDWTFDVGSWITQEMFKKGMRNFNIPRKKGNQDMDLVSMRYNYFDHIGKVSWDLDTHMDRFSEIVRRRNYVEEQLEDYQDIDVRGKFISGLK